MTSSCHFPSPAEALTALKAVLSQCVATSPGRHTPPQIIAVSKEQPRERILAALEAGHHDFGENRVQDAAAFWPEMKQRFPDVRLHLIGPLQSNKAADAVALFDVIHTVDRAKIAEALAKEMKAQGRPLPCMIQVNVGEEPQKSGVAPKELPELLAVCRNAGLNITGLMAIPPANKPPAPYFALLKKLANRYALPELSMGMSGDYETAARLGATYVRIGTAIFGKRN